MTHNGDEGASRSRFSRAASTATKTCLADEAHAHGSQGPRYGSRTCRGDDDAEEEGGLPRRHQALLGLIEQAREERGSPPLWDVVADRLDEANRQRDAMAPMLDLLDQIRERVDDETWGLIVDFEWCSSREVVTGIEIGLELGYDHGRMSALVEAQTEDASGPAATGLVARLADLLGDTEAGHHDVLLALFTAVRATVIAARSEQAHGGRGQR